LRQGQLRWGLAVLEGRGVARDVVAGESWLRRAAHAGDIDAAALLGHLCAKGGELPPNYAEATIWLGRAAARDHAAAARMLGQLHLSGAAGVADPTMASFWLRRAAVLGDAPARADLGNLVLSGRGAPEALDVRGW